MADNDNRCWPGYEPVKGKNQHEQGSCRPKAESKLTGSEKQFRSKRERQLDNWQAEHPNTRKSAAQHLHAPDQNAKAKKSSSKPRGKRVSKKSSGSRSK